MELLDVVKTRKSVRSFLDKPVPRELIEKIIEVGTFAPTNCNQQLWNFTVVEDASTKVRLIKEAASSTLIRRAPVLIVVSYDGWNYKEALQGASLAVGHMLLAATEFGLGSLPMNSYGGDNGVKRILGIPESQTICCFILLGFPDEGAQTAPIVPRRDFREVIHWGNFGSKKQIPFSYNPDDWTKDDLVGHQKFYCRKTVLGKEMDIMSDLERELVRKELNSIQGRVADVLSYDGSYIREFPEGVEISTFDLCKETAQYTNVAAVAVKRKINTYVLGEAKNTSPTSTLLFRMERIPVSVRSEVYRSVSGELIIIARKQNILLTPFFWTIRLKFGKDIRKTGIFNFFGPYKPICLSKIVNELKEAGFKDVEWHGYFIFPAFFEQIYQMFLQYIASEGSSYLHREKRSDMISRLINFILKIQGMRRFGFLGSVAVIRCKK